MVKITETFLQCRNEANDIYPQVLALALLLEMLDPN